jgi:hypothetical protein
MPVAERTEQASVDSALFLQIGDEFVLHAHTKTSAKGYLSGQSSADWPVNAQFFSSSEDEEGQSVLPAQPHKYAALKLPFSNFTAYTNFIRAQLPRCGDAHVPL